MKTEVLCKEESLEYFTSERCAILELSNDADVLVFLAICTPRFRPGCYVDLEA